MPIEFKCAGCHQTLRVPDESAGKQARCPNCQAIAVVPSGANDTGAAPPGGSGPLGGSDSTAGGASPSDPFGGSPPPKPTASDNPFAMPSNPTGASSNPYLPPQPFENKPAPIVTGGNIVATQVEAGDVINYAWEVWKNNLGLLVGVVVTVAGINWAIAIGFIIAQAGAQQGMGGDEGEVVGALINLLSNIVTNCVSIYLGIGSTQISLRLARGQAAEFADLFRGGPLFFPVLGASILFGMATGLGLLLLIVPGILVLLLFWPFYYLVVEQKSGVIESFSTAYEVAKGNAGTTFVLFLAGFGITLLGVIAFCVGILFAVPLAQMLWIVAYLMMTGQLSSRAGYQVKGLA